MDGDFNEVRQFSFIHRLSDFGCCLVFCFLRHFGQFVCSSTSRVKCTVYVVHRIHAAAQKHCTLFKAVRGAGKTMNIENQVCNEKNSGELLFPLCIAVKWFWIRIRRRSEIAAHDRRTSTTHKRNCKTEVSRGIEKEREMRSERANLLNSIKSSNKLKLCGGLSLWFGARIIKWTLLLYPIWIINFESIEFVRCIVQCEYVSRSNGAISYFHGQCSISNGSLIAKTRPASFLLFTFLIGKSQLCHSHFGGL